MANKKDEAKARNNIKSSKMDGTVYLCNACSKVNYWHETNKARFIIPDYLKGSIFNRCPRCAVSIKARPANFKVLGKVQNGVVKYYDGKKLVPLKDAPKRLIDKHSLRLLNAKRKKAYF